MIKLEKGKCSDCSCFCLIVNKRHSLCRKCNRIRLDRQQDNQKIRQKNTFLRFKQQTISNKTKLKRPKKSIKLKTNKQASIDRKLTTIYQNLHIPKVCSGCGTTQTLTHSHLIRRSLRSDLVTDPNNIVYHCLENKCHVKWESNDIITMSQLHGFNQHLLYVYENDNSLYCRLTSECNNPSIYLTYDIDSGIKINQSFKYTSNLQSILTDMLRDETKFVIMELNTNVVECNLSNYEKLL